LNEHAPGGSGYEVSDASPRAILKAAIVLGAVVVAAAAGLVFYLQLLRAREARKDAPLSPVARQEPDRRPPQPRLQERPFEDVRALRHQQQDAATTYGWVDESKGVVRIPVEHAMRLVAERGLPARAASPGPAASPTSTASPQPPPSPFASPPSPHEGSEPAPRPSPSPGERD
jgi:hypothetical protein